MNFKNFKLKPYLINVGLALLYPLVRGISAENHMLVFSDTCLVIGMFVLIYAVVNSLFLHGDYDITGYVANRTFNKDRMDYDEYKKEQEEKRKDSFNYPLLSAITLFIISYISSLLV